MPKFENIPVEQFHTCNNGGNWQDFLIGLRDAEVGQSFVAPDFKQNYRLILSVTETLLGKKFRTRKDPDGKVRIGRIA